MVRIPPSPRYAKHKKAPHESAAFFAYKGVSVKSVSPYFLAMFLYSTGVSPVWFLNSFVK